MLEQARVAGLKRGKGTRAEQQCRDLGTLAGPVLVAFGAIGWSVAPVLDGDLDRSPDFNTPSPCIASFAVGR